MGYEYFIVVGVFALLGKVISSRLKSKFEKFSQTPMSSNLSGKEVAEKMLKDSGITDVVVQSVRGQLTDHYNPTNKTVNLSEVVYSQRNVAAAAVAAHECGHAIQHSTSYAWLGMRSRLVPLVSVSSKFLNIVLMIGLVLAASGNSMVLGVGIGLFALTTLFSLVTLPVEFDASKRALVWLEGAGVTQRQEHENAKEALNAAAMTYVVAALASVAQLMYFVSIFLRSRD